MFLNERAGEINNLRLCHNMLVVEERAKQAKILMEKQENKANWESQMHDKEQW